jgi:pimeloyl-ACP methyl ester carboxylesterase
MDACIDAPDPMKTFAKIAAGVLLLLVVVAGAGIAMTWQPDRPVSTLLARWAQPPSQFLDLDGMRVHYRDEGPRDDPTPLVLIHGTSTNLQTWDGWVAELKNRKRVIRFDLPGFGLTGPSPDHDYRIGAYVRFTLQVLDKLGVQRFIVAGNSLGGDVAWEVAVSAPQRVESLILIDASGYSLNASSIPLGFRIARTPVLNQIARYSLPRGVIESSIRDLYGDPSRVTPELVDRIFELTLREGNRDALIQRIQQMELGAHADRIKTIKTPTLILWGGRDHLIPPDNARRFEHDIAGSKLVVFDDLGHVPYEEDPARTVAAVKTFLGL